MKKVLLVFLTLALSLCAFGCNQPGETFTEVPEADRAETLSTFVNDEQPLTMGFSNDVRVYLKVTSSDGTATEGVVADMKFMGTGTNVKVFAEMKGIQNDVQTVLSVLAIDGTYIYAASPIDSEGNLAKVKVPYTPEMAEEMGIPDAMTAISSALNYMSEIELDPDDAEFMATIGKMEISGKAGADRSLRLTISETDADLGMAGNMVLTMKFNAENKVVGIAMTATIATTADDVTETQYIEVAIEKCTGIAFPSFADYVEQVA